MRNGLSSYICTMSLIIDQLKETVGFIRNICPAVPEVGIVLGSGLGNFLKDIIVEASIPYEDIPHFPVSTVKGHKGALVFGSIQDKKIVAMAGRFHFYEGYTAREVIYPIRAMQRLGIKNLLLSNAAGGVNPDFKVGDLMMINDHISLATVNPLLGPNDELLGRRFPDMSEPYCPKLMAKARAIGAALKIPLKEGVYFGVTGPTFETRAEYKMIHRLGADAVGMSTVQETIAAVHMGLPVFAVSVITDLGMEESPAVITHEEVLEAAGKAEPLLTALFKQLIVAL